MDINYVAVLICGVASMILGTVWYGPLFGKKWMKITGASEMDQARRKEMQKRAMPLYGISFVLTLVQAAIFGMLIEALPDMSPLTLAMWMWLAFIIPTVAAGSMWNNDSKEVSWARFLIQAPYYLVLFIIFGLVFGR